MWAVCARESTKQSLELALQTTLAGVIGIGHGSLNESAEAAWHQRSTFTMGTGPFHAAS